MNKIARDYNKATFPLLEKGFKEEIRKQRRLGKPIKSTTREFNKMKKAYLSKNNYLKIRKIPFVEKVTVKENTLEIETSSVILHYNRGEIVNLGRYILSIDCYYKRISAKRKRGCLKYLDGGNDYPYHPHINSSEEICFGGYYDEFMFALKTGQINIILAMFWKILIKPDFNDAYIDYKDLYEYHGKEVKK